MHGSRLVKQMGIGGDVDAREKNFALAALAQKSPIAWGQYVSNGAFKTAPHLEFIEKALLRVETGESTRVVISCPPQHGKSTSVSGYFTSWWLGKHPQHRVMLITMQGSYSRDWGRFSKDALVARGQEVFGVSAIARGSAARWDCYQGGRRTGGGLRALGILGSLPGNRGDLIVVDDIIRGEIEADSALTRDRHWNIFSSGILTRLKPPGRIVIIMTRWNSDDLIGRLKVACDIGSIGTPFEFIELPALAEEGDPMGRAPGEALWPEEKNKLWLETQKKDIVPHVWESQYMCRPSPKAGSVFKSAWYRYYALGSGKIELPVYERPTEANAGQEPKKQVRDWGVFWGELVRYGTVDLAVSRKKKADYTVVCSWGYHRALHCLVLLEVIRTRVEGPSIIPLLLEAQTRLDLGMVYCERPGALLKDRIGPIEVDAAEAGVRINLLHPVGDKLQRAIESSLPIAAGQVWFLQEADWLTAFELEMGEFTGQGDAHDDQVDAACMGISIFKEWERSVRIESRPKGNEGAGRHRGRPEQRPMLDPGTDPGQDFGYRGEWDFFDGKK